MRKILLRASRSPEETGPPETYPAQLPDHWGEVPLGPYAELASAKSSSERIRAIAALCAVEPRLLLEDTGLFGKLLRELSWLSRGPLPAELHPCPKEFTHEGRKYLFLGGLHKMKAGQLEAVLRFVHENEGAPLRSAPAVLAVLYSLEGEEQTADSVAAAAEAFERLPVALGWPFLLDFLRNGASAALHIRAALAQGKEAEHLLALLEAATRGASTTYSLRLRRWLVRTWIQSARRLLSPFWSESNITGKRAGSGRAQ